MDIILKLIPQDVSGDLALTPITSKLCNFCSFVCVVLATWAHLSFDYADTRPAVKDDEDPWMVWFLQCSATLALGGLIYESCFAFSIKIMGMQSFYEGDIVFRRRLRMNRKMMVVFMGLTTCYHCMAFDIQYVHKGWIAEYNGGHQVVYSVRYIEWVFCAPIVLSVSGQLDHAKDGSPRNGLIPSSLLTGIYCLISWQGIVVKDVFAAYVLITWAFVSYFVASLEQLAFAWYIKDKGIAGPLRAGLLFYLTIMIGVYGVVYLLPIHGWISAFAENKFYCIGDISFKLGTSIMLIAANDLANNEDMRCRAETTAQDLERLIQTASVPIFGVDRDCRINEWNEKSAELTGLPKEKAIGMNLMTMMGNGQAEAQDVLSRALKGETTSTLETSLWIQDGPIETKKARVVLSATPRKDKTGAVIGVTLVGYDLTEVAAFRESESRKISFMAVVSHELRSPLHGIIGLMENLCEGETDPGRIRFMTMVINCATRLLDLVVNIMEMASMASKDASGKATAPKALSHDPVDLTKIVEEIVVLVKSSTDKAGNLLLKKTVQIVNEVRDLPIIEADAHKCTQVFYNIITNACKFTRAGSIKVTSKAEDNGEWVSVSVTDTGKGIARGSLERIFQPFEQEDNSMVRGYQGIGLGLPIANEVVQRHGGRITAESEIDVGTTFTVRLPMVMTVAAQAPKQQQESPPKRQESKESTRSEVVEALLPDDGPPMAREPTTWKPVVLSVDDDVVNQEVIRGILGSGFEVHVAVDGYEALDFLRQCGKLPDVMLLDVSMPGITGFEVCRIVRGEMNIPPTQLPILMLSALTMSDSIIEGLDSGANDYVTKPFHKQLLKAHLNKAIRIKQMHALELKEAAGPGRPKAADGTCEGEALDPVLRRRK